MDFLRRITSRDTRKKSVSKRTNGRFTDAYQDSLNKMGEEQFSKIVSRGIQMPGLAAL